MAGDAQVALAGQFETAAGAGAVNHRHGGMPALAHRTQRAVHQFAVIGLALRKGVALSRKFGDIGAGGECGGTGAAQHHAAQFIVL